ncbi:MAG: UDP-N-acetylmuramoyl-tripeptide--D-alanyl-D-alanine ligase [Treponema sp.]|nr:UDP-N-acetylmuramoyl-tripeptide--D-alanyl-D-alanine ligase [Treponema sp.]
MNNESLMTKEELLASVNGTAFGSGDFVFTNVTTDSRNVTEKSLFVPLIGEFQDGHKYVPQSLEKGASVVFIARQEDEKNHGLYEVLSGKYSVTFVVVENTLTALQNAAEGYVAKFPNLIKVAITGSCGKTTTKEMAVAVISQKYKTVYTKGNFNSETGLPLSVFNIRSEHECGVFEMGMNRENEIGEISRVLKPSYALITNIGTAHIGILGSRENIAKEKRKVFDWMNEKGVAVVPSEDDYADYLLENAKGASHVKFPTKDASYVKDMGLKGQIFTWKGETVNLPVSGYYNYVNATGVCALADSLGVSPLQIKTGLEGMNGISGRMEISEILLKNDKKITLVKDCYNANPVSMAGVIDWTSKLEIGGKKILVLGDMKELGEKSEEAHKEIGRKVLESKADEALFVGDEIKVVKALNLPSASYFSAGDFESIGNKILETATENSVVVLKGSNSMKLWEVVPYIKKEEAAE